MPNECELTPRRIDAALDGELSADENSAFARHTSVCGACRRTYDLAQRAVVALEALPRPAANAAFAAAVMRRAREARAVSVRRRRLIGWLLSAGTATAGATLVGAWKVVLAPALAPAAAFVAECGVALGAHGRTLIKVGDGVLGVFGKVLGALGTSAGSAGLEVVKSAAAPYALALALMGALYFIWRTRPHAPAHRA